MKNIPESDTVGMLAYLRDRKLNGSKVSDVLYMTAPGREAPVNAHEAPRISSVQFYDAQGNNVTSTQTEVIVIALVEVPAPGPYVWVKSGHEALLEQPEWKNLPRIRFAD